MADSVVHFYASAALLHARIAMNGLAASLSSPAAIYTSCQPSLKHCFAPQRERQRLLHLARIRRNSVARDVFIGEMLIWDDASSTNHIET